jgi:predicted nucleic acid-binding Zn ribbon protein
MGNLGKLNRYNNSVKLGAFLDNILAGFGLSKTLAGWKIVVKWQEIVGEKNAEHSRAIRFSDDTLLVKVTDPVWRQELQLDSDRILAEIHKQPGGKVVKKIHFVS